MSAVPPVSDLERELRALAAERILVLDGAMGTMIQSFGLDETAFRGARFDAWNREVRGNNDLLNLTRPDPIRDIHLAYFRAGADIVATNTFSSTRIAQADYGMETIAYELNLAGAKLAREAAVLAEREDGKRRFVAGAIGPTNRTASLSPDVSNPGFRATTFDDLVATYGEQARGLMDGGVDILLIETVFDTLEREGRDLRARVAVRGAGDPPAGDDFGHDHGPLRPHAFGPDAGGVLDLDRARAAARGRPQLRARRARDARPHRRDRAGRRYAGLRLSERRIAQRVRPLRREPGLHGRAARRVRQRRHRQYRRRLLRNDAGAHPRHRRCGRRQAAAPRAGDCQSACGSPGLEPFELSPQIPFVNIGERTNVTGSARFRKLITAGDYAAALEVARQQVENGAQVIDVNMDEGLLDSERAMTTFLNLIAAEPDIARVPIMIDSSKWSVIEAGLKCVQGKGIVNSISMKEGEEAFKQHARLVRRYGAAVVVMAFDEKGQADTLERKIEICRARLPHPDRRDRLPARGHHLRSQYLRGRDRHRGARQLRRRFHRGGALHPQATAARARLGRRLQPFLRLPRQRAGARGDARGVPLPRDPGRDGSSASSMPGSCRSMTISIRSCARPARTWCSIGAPTRPTGCSRWRNGIAAAARRRRRPISPGAHGPSRSGSNTRWCTASPSSSKSTSRRRASSRRGRST